MTAPYRSIATVLLWPMVTACALSSQASDQPALIVSPSNESRAELQRTIDAALGRPVTLANDALTRDSVLTIERAAARDPSGRRIEVRETSPPEVFRLIQRGGDCVLIHERTKTETKLRATQCKPVG